MYKLGQVSTKMWQEYDFNYYEKNKSKMLRPQDVAVKIVEMILDTKTYKNGDWVEMYNNIWISYSLICFLCHEHYIIIPWIFEILFRIENGRLER